MITRLEISGFKTFDQFEIDFSTFVVIAGTNGSGKSNLFDAIMLVSKLADKDLKFSFKDQRGAYRELFTQYSPNEIADEIKIAVELFLDKSVRDEFNKEENLGHRRLRYELIISREIDQNTNIEKLVVVHESLKPIKRTKDIFYRKYILNTKWDSEKKTKSLNFKAYIDTKVDKNNNKIIQIRQDKVRGGRPTLVKDLERTVLSGVTDVSFPHAYAAKKEMLNWRQFQFNPSELRRPSEMLGNSFLDIEGKNLAAMINYIHVSDPDIINQLSRSIHEVLPEIKFISIDKDNARQQFVLMARSIDGRVFSSSVLSEGTLRIIALIALTFDERHRGLICFEEPENGIHPYRMSKILTVLRRLATDFVSDDEADLPLRQVFINTHSVLVIKELDKNFKDCDMYFARLANKVDAKRRISYKITRLIPVNRSIKNKVSIPFEPDYFNEISKFELEEYLQILDSEPENI